MSRVLFLAQCLGLGVMAIAGVGLFLLIAYFAASEYFKFAVNRIGGFTVLKNYMIHRVEFSFWLQQKQSATTPKEPTP